VLIPIAIWAARRLRAGVMDGSIFRGFLIVYLAFRVALDFVKPEPRPYLGLTATQIVGTIVIAYLVWVAQRSRAERVAGARATPDPIPPLAETAHGR
ncbi:MAG TPA: hypothetical protein VFR25_09605, partial [Candidatus Eisenbacteria bacterium]|nr:hypothetical protein [Candidatus Eisenbacteria bacterium]